ncbi:GH25 family lysozyme [Arthrobacter sp. zg-Y179]|uniref:GH25 family lysozyme n=1 Tax=Arthrobacter sp. zg-Y179 TaxID=2894188 RepID=UPI001E31398A|nr:GH25 family lysozyme [Arthrobacter sp. zg-Y179]MCC9173111.1 lysozyme M1 [Arthrobacter sp. zg-Y179]
MKNPHVFRIGAAALALALAFGVVEPAAGWAQDQADPEPVRSAPAVPGTLPATDPTEPSVTEPAEAEATNPAAVPSPGTELQPATEPTEQDQPSPSASPADELPQEEELLDEVGSLGAHMGQGLDRLLTTGDPQVATPEEVELREAADAGDLPQPETIAPQTPVHDGSAASGPVSAASAASGTAYVKQAFDSGSAMAKISPAADWRPAGIQGMDVSSHQKNVNWTTAWNQGARFAYVKATEGTYYKNEFYGQQYNGSANVGMYRGAYHFAIPSLSESGGTQANYFMNNGGGWSSNTKTLPPLLDIEYNPYPSLGDTCYDMSPSQMVSWIKSFSDTVRARTGISPMIYTTTDWWKRCTGNSAQFSDHQLHIANYNTVGAGTLPNGWSTYAIWQYSSSGPFAGDSNVWNGNEASLDAATRFEVSPAFEHVRKASGVGNPVSRMVCGLKGGGCLQDFQYGTVYSTPFSGVRAVSGSIRSAWWATRGQDGPYGYPVSDLVCGLKGGGCLQDFQNGTFYATPGKAARAVSGSIRTVWWAGGGQDGPQGYPVSDLVCGLVGGGCLQDFENGTFYASAATAARAVSGSIRTAWWAAGGQNSTYGYPVSDQVCGLKGGGCLQDFQNGTYYTTPSSGTRAVSGAIRTAWWAAGGQNSTYGYPVSDQVCGLKGGGCLQDFQNGTYYATPGNTARAVTGPIRTAWWAAGGQNSTYGYPVSDQVCGLKGGGCLQDFQNGSIYVPADNKEARSVTGSIRTAWWSAGAADSSYGYPASNQVCGLLGGGCLQDFQNGTYYATPGNTARAVTGPIRTAWWAAGGQNSTYGYPVSDQVCGLKGGGCLQDFQNGTYYTTPGNTARAVTGPIRTAWWAAGGQNSTYGYPVSDQVCGLLGGGCLQDFQNGTYYTTPSNGTRAVSGTIRTAWWAAGGQNSTYGYPVSDQVCGLKGGGCLQDFQNGTFYSTPKNGTRGVTGAIRSAWWAAGGQNSTYGYPVSDQVCGRDGVCRQDFEKGTIRK